MDAWCRLGISLHYGIKQSTTEPPEGELQHRLHPNLRARKSLTRKHLLCTWRNTASPELVPTHLLYLIPIPGLLCPPHSAFQIQTAHFRLGAWLGEELWGKSWSLASEGPEYSKTPCESGATGTQGREPCCDWDFTGRKGWKFWLRRMWDGLDLFDFKLLKS